MAYAQYNDWTVTGEYTKGRRYFCVKCICGYNGIRRADHVLSGRSKRCKTCSAKQTLKDHPKHPYISHKGVGNLTKTFYLNYKHGAKRRGIKFDVSIQYLWELYLAQDSRCALTGVPIKISDNIKDHNVDWEYTTASLDRIDNSIGYIPGNIQWVHKEINILKNDLDIGTFKKWCKLVADYNKECK